MHGAAAAPAARSPQGCCAHRSRASAELCCQRRATAQRKDRHRPGRQRWQRHHALGQPGPLRTATLTASAVTSAGPGNGIITAERV